jgi:hypothetical protein
MAGSPLIADGLRPAEVGVNQAFLETAGNSRPPSDEELVSASQNHCVRVLAGASVGWGLRRRAYSERSLCGRNPLGRTEDETCAAEIEDHRRLVWLVHFVPQPPHMNIRLVGGTNL